MRIDKFAGVVNRIFGWYFHHKIHVKQISWSESKGYAFDIIIKSTLKRILWNLHLILIALWFIRRQQKKSRQKIGNSQREHLFRAWHTCVYSFRQKKPHDNLAFGQEIPHLHLCETPLVSVVYVATVAVTGCRCHFLLFNLFFITVFRHSLIRICSLAFKLNNY